MDTYYVTIMMTPQPLSDRIYLGSTRELSFAADDFGHAEEQAKPYVQDDEEITKIVKDYS
jgi:hypothetical protein